MSYSLRSGPTRVICSGIATTFMGNDFVLEPVEVAPLVLTFTFRTDPSVDDVAVQIDTAPDHLTLHLVNFDTPEGRGTASPMLIGETDDRLLFLHFRCSRHGKTAEHTLTFTVFQGTKSDLQWEPAP